MDDFLTDDITLQKGVVEMITVASEYCLFIEKAAGLNSQEMFEFFQRVAPLLYLKGSLLPEIEEPDQPSTGHFVTEEQWEGVFNTLRHKFGKDDLFYLVDKNQEVVQASISENLADIYQDLKDFILFFNQNTFTARVSSLVQLRQLFYLRWGFSLINALMAVHSMLAHQRNDDDDFQWAY